MVFLIFHDFRNFSGFSCFFEIFHDIHEVAPRKDKNNQSSKKHEKTSQQHVPAGPAGQPIHDTKTTSFNGLKRCQRRGGFLARSTSSVRRPQRLENHRLTRPRSFARTHARTHARTNETNPISRFPWGTCPLNLRYICIILYIYIYLGRRRETSAS